MKKVFRVDSVDVLRLPVPEKTWLVKASGVCRTSGWRNPRLRRTNGKESLTLDFIADAPRKGEAVMKVLTPTVAVGLFQPDPDDHGVAVHSETNRLTKAPMFLTAMESGNLEADFPPFEDADPDFMAEDEGSEQTELTLASTSLAKECDRRTLSKIPLYPEIKFNGGKCYKRWRYNITELEWCYPSDLGEEAEDAIRKCLPGSIAAGIAGFAAGGPAGAIKAFIHTLITCVGAQLGKKVTVRVRSREHKGRWSRC